MKRFILPVINLIALIISAVIFGLGANSAVHWVDSVSDGRGNWYQLVWDMADKPTVVGVLGFFFFVVAVVACLVAMVPFKARKYVEVCVGALFIAAGVMFLLTPDKVFTGANAANYIKTSSLIAMSILAFVSGGLTLIGAGIDLIPEKK